MKLKKMKVSDPFIRERTTCIQAVIVYTVDGHTRTIENGETKDALLY